MRLAGLARRDNAVCIDQFNVPECTNQLRIKPYTCQMAYVVLVSLATLLGFSPSETPLVKIDTA